MISEEIVLSGIYNYGLECYLEVELWLDENTFTTDLNKVLYKVLKQTIQREVDYSSFLAQAHTLGFSDFLKPYSDKVKEIFAEKPNINAVPEQAKKIRRLQFARDLKNKLRKSASDLDKVTGEESLDSIMGLVENPVQDLSLTYIREEDNNPTKLGDYVDEFLENLDKVQAVGISSGYPGYDYAIGGGFQKGCIDLITARSKEGKSFLALNIGINVARQGIPVLYLDTEMGKDDHVRRGFGKLSGVEINDIKFGHFRNDRNKEQAVLKASEEFKKLPLMYKNITGKPFEDVLSISRRWILKEVGYGNPCLIIYDYFKLTDSKEISSVMQEYQVLGFQITKMHNFCVELQVPCLAYVQANRDGITKEDASIVSGSDRLVWLATSFSLFKSKTEEERVEDGVQYGNKKLVTIVSRHGPDLQDDGYLCLDMNGSTGKINEKGFIRRIKTNPQEQSNPVHF